MATNASSQTQLQILTLQFMYAMKLKAEATREIWLKRSMNQQVYSGETTNYPAGS